MWAYIGTAPGALQHLRLKSDPFMNGKTCMSCHQAHAFVEHKKAAPADK